MPLNENKIENKMTTKVLTINSTKKAFYVMSIRKMFFCFSSCRVPFKVWLMMKLSVFFMITQWKEVCCFWLHDMFMFCYRYSKYVWNVSFELICSFFSRKLLCLKLHSINGRERQRRKTFYNSHPAPTKLFFVQNHVPSDITSKIN